jgi:hypothetical protein
VGEPRQERRDHVITSIRNVDANSVIGKRTDSLMYRVDARGTSAGA